jgi:hypothetical protein
MALAILIDCEKRRKNSQFLNLFRRDYFDCFARSPFTAFLPAAEATTHASLRNKSVLCSSSLSVSEFPSSEAGSTLRTAG